MMQEALDYVIFGQIPEQTKEVNLEVTLGPSKNTLLVQGKIKKPVCLVLGEGEGEQ